MAPTATSPGETGGNNATAGPSYKRRRLSPAEENKAEAAEADPYSIYDEEDYDSKRFVPLRQRKLQELQRISGKSALAAGKSGAAAALVSSSSASAGPVPGPKGVAAKDKDDDEEEEEEEEVAAPKRSTRALLDEARELREQEKYADKSEAEKLAEEERQILEAHAARKKLASANELAKGIAYTEPLTTSWRPPRFVRERSEAENEKLREQNHIIADGDDVPPLITNFRVSRQRQPIN